MHANKVILHEKKLRNSMGNFTLMLYNEVGYTRCCIMRKAIRKEVATGGRYD